MRWTSASFAVGVAILAAAALTGCSSAPPDMTVKGTLEIALDQSDGTGGGLYPQAWNGEAQITVTNPSGTVIGVTTADGQNAPQQTPTVDYQYLTYGWTVKVPEGESFYGIAVSGVSGTLHYTQQQMKQGPALCIGDACGG
jgi:Tfp pilus assembly protein PilX